MLNKPCLLIHGPVGEEWLDAIWNSVSEFKVGFLKIVLVSYASDLAKYGEILSRLRKLDNLAVVECRDILNPGFFNINRQIKTVRCGLQLIPEDGFVIKLRNDQVVDFNKLFSYCKGMPKGMLLSTNCFTRRDRLYHPSDMLLCSSKSDMELYYSCDYMSQTHLMHVMEAQAEYEASGCRENRLRISPESYLFRNYLTAMGWDVKETKSDSNQALKRHIRLVDSWDIGFRWKKKRTPFLKGNSIILPYYFTMRPFAGGPLEKCRCINRFHLYGEFPSIRAMFYIAVSRFVFYIGVDHASLARNALLRTKLSIFKCARTFAKVLPYTLAKNLIPRLERKIGRYLARLR